MAKLYVGNLPFTTTDEELGGMFSAYGQVTSAVVIKDKFSGRSKGFGFVELDDDAAKKAREELNGKDMGGRNIVIDEARPPREQGSFDRRPQGGGRPQGRGGRY